MFEYPIYRDAPCDPRDLMPATWCLPDEWDGPDDEYVPPHERETEACPIYAAMIDGNIAEYERLVFGPSDDESPDLVDDERDDD